jgi:Uma2 family endonuclease
MATVSAIRIGPADHGRRMTLEEFFDAEETEGYRYELARGVLEVTQIPNDPHGDLQWFLIAAIAAFDQEHRGLIRRVGGGDSTRLWLPGLVSSRHPDVAVVFRNASRDWHDHRIPSLVMEIVSKGREARDRDYVAKRQEYLAYGLLEYWIIDHFERKVTVLTRRGDLWHEQIFSGDQSAQGRLLPGFSVKLVDLWNATEPDPDDQQTGA